MSPTKRRLWVEDLDVEDRVGVPHYVPGQIKAWTDPADGEHLALLRFVDRMGYAWLVCCTRESGQWVGELAIRVSAAGLTQGWQEPPAAFRCTPAIIAALDEAAPFPAATL